MLQSTWFEAMVIPDNGEQLFELYDWSEEDGFMLRLN